MEQPKWHEYMLSILELLKDGKERTKWEIIDSVSVTHELTEELKKEITSTGELRYVGRIGWALTYLKQSGLIASPKRGHFVIDNDGLEFLKKNPTSMSEKDLEKYTKYLDFKKRERKAKQTSESNNSIANSSITPDEAIDMAVQEIKASVCAELLEKARSVNPTMFEIIVIELVKRMGYGDENDPMSGIRVGGSGDGGIDGIVKQDKLGLDMVYIQAKRYKENNDVGASLVRDFIGSLAIKGAKKGIFITTSKFTSQAMKHAEETKEYKIILIDGERLVELMYEFGVGVDNKRQIVVKRINNDFFEE